MQIEYNQAVVDVSNEPLVTKGPIEMHIPATTYTWGILPDELENALRRHIHDTLKHLPAKHFVKVEPIIHAEGTFEGISFTVVVPGVH